MGKTVAAVYRDDSPVSGWSKARIEWFFVSSVGLAAFLVGGGRRPIRLSLIVERAGWVE